MIKQKTDELAFHRIRDLKVRMIGITFWYVAMFISELRLLNEVVKTV